MEPGTEEWEAEMDRRSVEHDRRIAAGEPIIHFTDEESLREAYERTSGRKEAMTDKTHAYTVTHADPPWRWRVVCSCGGFDGFVVDLNNAPLAHEGRAATSGQIIDPPDVPIGPERDVSK